MSTLTLITIAHIQSYIFERTNRLRESVGASWLAQNAFKKFERREEEKIFIGGGQAALRFRGVNSEQQARKEIGEWSLELLKEAPGLRVVVAHLPYEDGHLQQAFLKARERHELEIAENDLPFGSTLGALPIVRSCPSTGLAANFFHKPSQQWLNVEAAKKREAEEESRANDPLTEKYGFPREPEEMGLRKGDSLIALIHADGDGVGQELKDVVKRDYSNDEQFIEALRKFSGALTELTASAMEALCEDLKLSLDSIYGHRLIERKEFPLRPIIGAGDDVTFVCPAKIGLVLAARYVQHFTKLSRQIIKKYGSLNPELTASAGVLLMPAKFPFARGYGLASQVASAAKRERRKQRSKEPWIDFHLLHEGITGDLETLRKLYTVDGHKSLLGRPYSLTKFDNQFHRLWHGFSEDWPHSSAKSLLEALTRGEEFAKARLDYLESRGRFLPGDDRARLFDLFDPLELLDHYAPINWETHQVDLPRRGNRMAGSRMDRERNHTHV
jgi:hypothetical protein